MTALIFVPVIVAALVAVLVTSIFLCLSGGQIAIAPSSFLAFAPAGRSLPRPIGPVLPAVAGLPFTSTLVAIIVIALGIMRIALAVTISVPVAGSSQGG